MMHITSGRDGMDQLHFYEGAKRHFNAVCKFVPPTNDKLQCMSAAELEEQLLQAREMLHNFYTAARSSFTERAELTVQVCDADCHEFRIDDAADASVDGFAEGAATMVDDAFGASMAAAVQAASQRM